MPTDELKKEIRMEYALRTVLAKEKRLLRAVSAENAQAIEDAHKVLPQSPVNLRKLADRVGVLYEFGRMPSGIYGSLKKDKKKGRYVIKIRKADARVRKRFTFAHELAHYFLHVDDSATDNFEVVEDIFLRSEHTTYAQEWQANALAAYILMPLDKVIEVMREMEPTLVQMASLFDVSQQAIQIRLQLPPDVTSEVLLGW